jgi:hypothetical protein
MRYHPISLNVIRQALKLSALPQPAKMKRGGQTSTPTGKIITQYACEFSFADLCLIWRCADDPHAGFEYAVMSTIDTAFCRDIAVVSVWHDGPDKPAIVGIVTIFDPYDRSVRND